MFRKKKYRKESLFKYAVVAEISGREGVKPYHIETSMLSVGMLEAKEHFEEMCKVDDYLKQYVIKVKQVRLVSVPVEKKEQKTMLEKIDEKLKN